MIVFLRSDPVDKQRWSLLLSEASLSPVSLGGGPWYPSALVALLSEVMSLTKKEAKEKLRDHDVFEFINTSGLKTGRILGKQHRVTTRESKATGLPRGEFMFGWTFRFEDKSHSALFKLAWGGGQRGVVELKLK